MLRLMVSYAAAPPDGEVYDDFGIPDTKRNIFLIGDGIGSHPFSEGASSVALAVAYSSLKASVASFREGEEPDEDPLELVKEAIQDANHALFTLSEHSPKFYHKRRPTSQKKKRAGTTLDICYLLNGTLYIGDAGDSGVYLIRGDEMTDLTLPEGKVRLGNDPIEKIKALRGEDSVSGYVGEKETIEPILRREQLMAGDYIVMATDGLTKILYDWEIMLSLDCEGGATKRLDPVTAAQRLVNDAAYFPFNVAYALAEMEKENVTNEDAERVMRNLIGKDAITVLTMYVVEV